MRVRQKWLKVLLILVIFFIGLSRLYLGVHFIADVLIGWTLGFLIVWLFVLAENRWGERVKEWALGKQLLAVVISTTLLIVIPLAIQMAFSGYVVPANWMANFTAAFGDTPFHPFSTDGVVTAAAAWFGLLVGLIHLKQIHFAYKADGTIDQRILRFVIGVIGVVLIWAGLKLVFPSDIAIISPILRFVRYALVGYWITALAPMVFRRLKLVE